jgi:hypothetical protein
MADRPPADTCAECVGAEAYADLSLEGKTAPGDVDDPLDDDTLNLGARGCEDHRQQIHYKPGIHPESHHDRATGPGQRI